MKRYSPMCHLECPPLLIIVSSDFLFQICPLTLSVVSTPHFTIRCTGNFSRFTLIHSYSIPTFAQTVPPQALCIRHAKRKLDNPVALSSEPTNASMAFGWQRLRKQPERPKSVRAVHETYLPCDFTNTQAALPSAVFSIHPSSNSMLIHLPFGLLAFLPSFALPKDLLFHKL